MQNKENQPEKKKRWWQLLFVSWLLALFIGWLLGGFSFGYILILAGAVYGIAWTWKNLGEIMTRQFSEVFLTWLIVLILIIWGLFFEPCESYFMRTVNPHSLIKYCE